jgi:AAA+ ATPase superfamily predicted ATPase
MENDVLGIQSPLYGRATCIIRLDELSYRECRLFAPKDPAQLAIEKWALLGGIPHYHLLLEPDKSLKFNLLEHVLDKSCPLSSEVDFILRQELRDSSNYNSIIQAIAFGATRTSEISVRSGISANNLSTYLINLLEIGIIDKEYSLLTTDGEKTNAHRALYRIQGNFMKFYYRFMYPNYTELELGSKKVVYEDIVLPEFNHFVSSVFERLCLQYLRFLNKLDDPAVRFTSIGRCFHKDIEIDLIAYLKNDLVIAAECKWTNARVGISTLKSLQSKCDQLRFYSNALTFFLFSKSGFDDELMELAKSDQQRHIRLISLDDLYADRGESESAVE